MRLSSSKLTLIVCLAVLASVGVVFSAETTVKKPDTDILVRIGDEVITRGELEQALAKLPERKREKYRDRTLDQLIEVKVFSKKARKVGLEKDPKIKEELEKATNEILAQYFIKKIVDKQAEPSEEEINKYYTENKDKFVVPEGVLIQQILVKKKEEAEELLKKLKRGASFEKLAATKSIAPSWKEKGVLGWLFKGKMDPELEKVAFNLEKDKLSDVIQTKDGYQIIKVLDKSKEKEISLEEAKANISYQLFWKKKRELIDNYYKEAKVNRNPDEKGILFKIGDEAFKEETLAPILAKVSEKEKEKVKQKWVDYLIETKVFSREARKVKLENDQEVADEIKRRNNKILADNFSKKFIEEKFKVSDKEIEDYYQSHLEEYRLPTKVNARIIVVKTKEDAENILKEIKEGAEFELLASSKSIHPTASKGGELGWIGKGGKDPALEKAAFSLEKGQISEIIKTEEGYQIIKVVDKGGGNIIPFNKVNEAIKVKLMTQRFQEEKQRYYKEAGVEIIKGNNQ